jgi:AcrR family transcriptional regulator
VPRRPDPGLEEKILNAAHNLWKKGGEKALTMRAVARAARTNTPAVYRRFRDRDDILRALLQRIRLEIAAELEKAGSAEEACDRYLNHALSHPREYELFYQHDYELNYARRSRKLTRPARPARDEMKRKLRARLGESPDDHERLLMALWMLTHGAAMLLIDKSILPEEAAEARKIFRASVRVLLGDAPLVRELKSEETTVEIRSDVKAIIADKTQ